MFILIGCSEDTLPLPMFYNGELIDSVIDGRRGQVTKVMCRYHYTKCHYVVRFGTTQGERWGRAYTEIIMKEFEIRRAAQ